MGEPVDRPETNRPAGSPVVTFRDRHHETAPDDSSSELELFQTARRLIQALERCSARIRSHDGLTLPQMICLRVVVADGSVTATALARRARMSASTIVGLLDELETRGFVRRDRDTRDRRLINVTATDSGKAAVKQNAPGLEREMTELLRRLPQTERAAIRQSLLRLTAHIDSIELQRQ
ncbi:MAG: MarR family winged helix-turn-helix transcriptional regulator [candidate division Zixibacteria bacterium]|jgi:DNA-binding MarR family transcriptional regulator|nr:MarR family winged helix-turn-helix transcriptional regulator [candidate division Zixibacteria bacterium]